MFQLGPHIQYGDMLPWWNQGHHRFVFDGLTGQYIVLGFYKTAGDPIGHNALARLHELCHFVQDKAYFLCVSGDREDATERRVQETFAPIRFIFDLDGTIHRAYGIGEGRLWVIADPMLRVIETIPYRSDGRDIRQLAALLAALPAPAEFAGLEIPPPILILQNVFERSFCQHLIDLYEENGRQSSGFMQEIAGRTVEQFDPKWKIRKDHIISDTAIIDQIKVRFSRRVGLMLRRVFHFRLSRMERHLVACYAAEDGGHFGPHRDDTVKATEHRRFAASINLNDDFGGGELAFPEFSRRSFKVPLGTAVIFSGSLLHQVTRVTHGRRYAFLPFLHDEEAERIRLANLPAVAST